MGRGKCRLTGSGQKLRFDVETKRVVFRHMFTLSVNIFEPRRGFTSTDWSSPRVGRNPWHDGVWNGQSCSPTIDQKPIWQQLWTTIWNVCGHYSACNSRYSNEQEVYAQGRLFNMDAFGFCC